MSSSSTLLLFGERTPLPERIPLRAGPLSMLFENGDLRYIRAGSTELVRRVYAATRDKNWGTVPNRLSNLQLDLGSDAFKISYDVDNQQGDIDFGWRATIVGHASGALDFHFHGSARSTFLKNRIGFCILHPAESAGALCEVEHVDGSIEQGQLPELISPDQPLLPFAEMRGFRQFFGPSTWLTLRMSGDIFEMEDQRNWTDASFKTFCTPLRLPFPVQVEAGSSIEQALHLSVHGFEVTPSANDSADAVHISVGRKKQALPKIGFGLPAQGQRLSAQNRARVKRLKPAHVRVDLDLAGPGYAAWLKRSIAEARALDAPLLIGLLIPVATDAADAALASLRKVVARLKPAVAAWLVFPWTENVNVRPPNDALIRLAKAHLASYDPRALIAAGSNADFIFASRYRDTLTGMQAFCTPTNPQLHAVDQLSVAETPRAQRAVVETARKLARGKPVLISPITLLPRWNPYVTAEHKASAAQHLPRSDMRQASLFGAGWVLASIKYLTAGGADHVTYFELAGQRGLMADGTEPSGWPVASGVYPMYHVFASITGFGGVTQACTSSEPLLVDGLLLRHGTQTLLLLTNLSGQAQRVALPRMAGVGTVHVLDESNALAAMTAPETFGAHSGVPLPSGKPCVITLPRFALARVLWSD